MNKILSILIPVYNEKEFVATLLQRVVEVELISGLKKELVIVDDYSTDGSDKLIEQFIKSRQELDIDFVYYRQPSNQGKGAAIREAIRIAKGDILIIQDADLEYNPREYNKVISPILDGEADVVYGSRFLVSERRRVLFFKHTLGNKFLTFLSNCFTDLNLSDIETCYKSFRASAVKTIPIRSNRFGFEPEITAKVAKRGFRIYEVPISYHGRTYQEGKKIGWKDGIQALYIIIKYYFIDDIFEKSTGEHILYSMSYARKFNYWTFMQICPFVGERVLEVGSGLGNLTFQLIPREKYICTDINDSHLNLLHNQFDNRDYISVHKLDITNKDHFKTFVEENLDTVICLNVLEHISDPIQALKNLRNLLKTDGRLILIVPNHPFLYCSLDKASSHEKRYSDELLRDELEQAGFIIEKIWSFNKISCISWYINGKIFKRKHLSKIQLKIFNMSVWLFKIIDPILPWRGLSLVAIAKKK